MSDVSIKFYTRHLTAVNENMADRAFALAHEVNVEREHIFRRAFFLPAGQRHVDRFEIESGRLDLVQIFNGAVVGFHGEIIPAIN